VDRAILSPVVALATACGATERDDARLDPPRPWSEASRVGERGEFSFTLTLEPAVPVLHEFFSVTTRLLDLRSGLPVEAADVDVDARMPDHGHGMATRPEHRELGSGRYETRGMKFHMPGVWVFSACARAQDREDCVALSYREDVP